MNDNVFADEASFLESALRDLRRVAYARIDALALAEVSLDPGLEVTASPTMELGGAPAVESDIGVRSAMPVYPPEESDTGLTSTPSVAPGPDSSKTDNIALIDAGADLPVIVERNRMSLDPAGTSDEAPASVTTAGQWIRFIPRLWTAKR